jgi:predicted RND superfamily exporter protein
LKERQNRISSQDALLTLVFRILRAVFVSSTGAIGWLVLVFSLFVLLGLFGVRWIIALIVVVSGSAAVLVARAVATKGI